MTKEIANELREAAKRDRENNIETMGYHGHTGPHAPVEEYLDWRAADYIEELETLLLRAIGRGAGWNQSRDYPTAVKLLGIDG